MASFNITYAYITLKLFKPAFLVDAGIPKTTLYNYLNSTVNKYNAQEHTQRLSRQQETHLVQWILTQEALGLGPTHQQVREFTGRVIKAGGDDVLLGKAWMEGFLRRNPEVRTVRGKPLDSCRLYRAITRLIQEFFLFLVLPLILEISPDLRFNIDETRLQEGRGSNGLVLGSAEQKAVIKKQPGSRRWTIIPECISATGRALTPLVIFKGLSVQNQWFPLEVDSLADWAFEASEKGWTSDAIALKWLQEIFIP